MTSEQRTPDQLLKGIREQSQLVNPTPLLTREFVDIAVADHDGNENATQTSSEVENGLRDKPVVRIMQWNLLAQGLCQSSDGFILCPPQALDWDYRKFRIVEEILSYPADVYCFQEVDCFTFLQDQLGKVDLAGVFFPKPDSPCLYQKHNYGPDGCAIFWNENRLKHIDTSSIILQDDSSNETNQVVLMCKFETISSSLAGRTFACAVTHLKSKYGYENLRWQQGKYLEKVLREQAGGTPLVICGDFNADPQEKVLGVIRSSQLGLCSAYTLLSKNREEPPYTTWKVRGGKRGKAPQEACHTIDYLFFTNNDFRCLRLLKLPTAEEIGPGFLPSYSYPSDHLSLVADLQLL